MPKGDQNKKKKKWKAPSIGVKPPPSPSLMRNSSRKGMSTLSNPSKKSLLKIKSQQHAQRNIQQQQKETSKPPTTSQVDVSPFLPPNQLGSLSKLFNINADPNAAGPAVPCRGPRMDTKVKVGGPQRKKLVAQFTGANGKNTGMVKVKFKLPIMTWEDFKN
jgi:hypothetical protein